VLLFPQGKLGTPGRLGDAFETGIEIETLVGILTWELFHWKVNSMGVCTHVYVVLAVLDINVMVFPWFQLV